MKIKFWQDWIILATAVWMFFSPFVLDYASASQPAAWLAWILSVCLIVSATEAVVFEDELGEWLDSSLGIALMVTPTALGFAGESALAINFVISGMIVTVCAISALLRDRRKRDEEYEASVKAQGASPGQGAPAA